MEKDQFLVLESSFMDYEGLIHKFIVTMKVDKEIGNNTSISCGLSICNPKHKYDKQLGIDKSLKHFIGNYALNSEELSYDYIEKLGKSLVEHIRECPQYYIKGYERRRKSFYKNNGYWKRVFIRTKNLLGF